MIRFTALALAAALSLSPIVASAAQTHACTPAEQGAAQLSNSGLSCTQWVAQFNGQQPQQTETARNERPAATPHS